VVRARNILAKVGERFGAEAVGAAELARRVDLRSLPAGAATEHWALALGLLRVDAVVRQAAEALELSAVAKHAHELAQRFNSFYHRHPVVHENDPGMRATRTAFVRVFHDGMVRLLELMGIGVPARM
jgi:arginyl-tRNA synthetase